MGKASRKRASQKAGKAEVGRALYTEVPHSKCPLAAQPAKDAAPVEDSEQAPQLEMPPDAMPTDEVDVEVRHSMPGMRLPRVSA